RSDRRICAGPAGTHHAPRQNQAATRLSRRRFRGGAHPAAPHLRAALDGSAGFPGYRHRAVRRSAGDDERLSGDSGGGRVVLESAREVDRDSGTARPGGIAGSSQNVETPREEGGAMFAYVVNGTVQHTARHARETTVGDWLPLIEDPATY